MVAAARKSDELMKSVVGYFNSQSFDELTTRRFWKDVESLQLRAPDSRVYACLAMLQEIRGNFADSLSNYATAVTLSSPEDISVALMNYATALGAAGYPERAAEQAVKAWEHDHGSVDAVFHVAHFYACSGKILLAREWLSQLETMNESSSELAPGVKQKVSDREREYTKYFVRNACDVLREKGISDEPLTLMIRLASDLLAERGLYSCIYTSIAEDDDSRWLSYECRVGVSPKECVLLNDQLIERFLTLSEDGDVGDAWSFTFKVDTSKWQSRRIAS